MIRCPDNQINASFIDISSAQLVPLQAPKHQPNRRSSGEASKTMDYKSVFTNLCLELQQNRSWIKGLGKNPQKSELIHWRQCLLSGGTEACSLGLRETPASFVLCPLSFVLCHSHEWRVDTASGKTLKKRNACLHAVRQAVEKKLRV